MIAPAIASRNALWNQRFWLPAARRARCRVALRRGRRPRAARRRHRRPAAGGSAGVRSRSFSAISSRIARPAERSSGCESSRESFSPQRRSSSICSGVHSRKSMPSNVQNWSRPEKAWGWFLACSSRSSSMLRPVTIEHDRAVELGQLWQRGEAGAAAPSTRIPASAKARDASGDLALGHAQHVGRDLVQDVDRVRDRDPDGEPVREGAGAVARRPGARPRSCRPSRAPLPRRRRRGASPASGPGRRGRSRRAARRSRPGRRRPRAAPPAGRGSRRRSRRSRRTAPARRRPRRTARRAARLGLPELLGLVHVGALAAGSPRRASRSARAWSRSPARGRRRRPRARAAAAAHAVAAPWLPVEAVTTVGRPRACSPRARAARRAT